MKKQKLNSKSGITLVSLIIYIILTIMVLGMLSIMTSNFRSNINNVNIGTAKDVEFDKLNLQLLRETKDANNKIREQESSETKIVFKSGNTYEYIEEDNAVYLNGNIKVADNIETCKFKIEKDEETLDRNILSDNVQYTDKNGDVAVIPAGFIVSGKESEQTIEDGLVIYAGVQNSRQRLITTVEIMGQQRVTEYVLTHDGSIDWTYGTEVAEAHQRYDQFVWIPVEDINSMVMCQAHETAATLTYDRITDNLVCNLCEANNITNTKFCGKLYATTPGDPGVTVGLTGQTYNADIKEPSVVEYSVLGDGYISSSEYQTTRGAYLVNSILGITDNNGIVESDETWYTNKTVANEVRDNFGALMQSRFNEMAISVAKNKGFYVGRYESSYEGEFAHSKIGKNLHSGINWYQMYKYAYNYCPTTDTSKGVTSEMIWGCQWDQMVLFLNSKTRKDGANNDFSFIVSNSERHVQSIKPTGQNMSDFVANLYDLEGNAIEFTQEASYTSRIRRGGRLDLILSVSNRRDDGYPYATQGRNSCSRLSLYIK